MSKIKICGLSRPVDIQYANELHPDYIGFVFYEKSKRYVNQEQAAELKKLLDPTIPAVGVFVNTPTEQIVELLQRGIIDIAQLHGDETEEDIRRLQSLTKKPVIKAVKVHCEQDILKWKNTSADYLLLDSGMGSGKTFDWNILKSVGREFFLAGGLNAANLKEALTKVAPFALDLSSGVEKDGVKDFEMMKNVVETVRAFVV